MKAKNCLWPLCLFLANAACAANANDAFLAATQQEFVRNTIAGTWSSGCHIEAESGSGFIATYRFSDTPDAALTHDRFEDSECLSRVQTSSVEGPVALQGLSVNESGYYVYKMSVSSVSGAAYPFLFHLESGTLTVVQSGSSGETLVMTPVREGEVQ